MEGLGAMRLSCVDFPTQKILNSLNFEIMTLFTEKRLSANPFATIQSTFT